jgi:signal transduction histidine kinase/CheY-like chemotaxis protein
VFRSLRWKLLPFLLLASLAILAYLEFVWVPRYLETQKTEYIEEVDHHLDSVIEGLIPLMLANQVDIISENLGELKKKNPDWRTIRLTSPNGQQLFPPMTGTALVMTDQTGLLTLNKPISYVGQAVGKLTVQLDLSHWLERRHTHHRQLILLLVGSIALQTLIWTVMVEAVVIRPMRRLSQAAKALARRQFDAPLPHPGKDEVGDLIGSFAAMRHDLGVYNEELLEEIKVRQAAERALAAHHQHLEEEIAERTAELVGAKDAALAANRAKSLFLANMSHELRTPLNAILGFSDMMRRDALLTENQRENLDIINRSGEHLLTLINDVLEMAKIEAGRLQLEIAPFDLGNMVRDVIEMMQLRAREKGLQLLLDQSSEFPRHIKGDEARLRQILINLVGNAVKFTGQGGVTIRLGVKQNTRRHLLIEVEDTGPGIRPEDQKRLFEPFVQLAEGSAAQSGTGLGLSITRQFVQLMGGTISVESTVGKGSLFRIELPVELARTSEVLKPENKEQGEVIGLAPGQPRYRILITEDQIENQLLLERLMTTIGLETKIAENGEKCVRIFQEWRPDFIWMDRRMPVMDGIEATRRIRKLPGGHEVKIAAVTASAFKEQQQELLDAGMDDFVRKPYRFEEIYDCLARQLGVRYLYNEPGTDDTSQPAPVQLTPAQLAVLPAELREALKEALLSLDENRIQAAIEQVGSVDRTLSHSLSSLAEYFDYPAILKALDETGSTP